MTAKREKPAFIGGKVERIAQLRWVPILGMRVNTVAQRERKQARVDALAADFDLEQFGIPTVNLRDGVWYIIDGQHRIEALKIWFGDGAWEDQHVYCSAYEGMTEQQEAESFLKLNDRLAVLPLAKFRVAVTAHRSEETEIDDIVRAAGLRISADRGGITAVGTLQRLYRNGGPDTLRRTLEIIQNAYGEAGLQADVIGGVGLLCTRLGGLFDDGQLAQRLGSARGGVHALTNKATLAKSATGKSRRDCVAAAAVEIHNSKPGRKLPNWWKGGE